jgi:prevent-host-death family protein
MQEISVSDAKARLLQLLDDVENGTIYRLTRHGRPIARLVPESELRTKEVALAVATIRAIGRRSKGMTADELLSARREGRRY